ncbi:MAG: hypothetical protein B6244_13290 [Candidatus Cloacimonetes bacterium 4572_55]|nr:MAG: hypothetical protein B6244_13290 [Candidatus Cloacimonetes bacterium 4572_55]
MINSWWRDLHFFVKIAVLIVAVPVGGFAMYSAYTYIDRFQEIRSYRENRSDQILLFEKKYIDLIYRQGYDNLQIVSETPMIVQSVLWMNKRFNSLTQSERKKKEYHFKPNLSKYIDLTIGKPTRELILQILQDRFVDIVMTEQNGFNIWGDYVDQPFDLRDTGWWYQTATQGFWVGDLQTDFKTGKIILPLAFAIKDENNNHIGVIKAGFRMEQILEQHIKETLPPGYFLTLTDRAQLHTIMLPDRFVSSDKKLSQLRFSKLDEQLDEQLDGRNERCQLVIDRHGKSQKYDLITSDFRINDMPISWRIRVFSPYQANFGVGFLLYTLLPTLFAGVILFSIYLFIKIRFISPLQYMHEQTEQVGEGYFNTMIRLDRVYELRPFAYCLNRLFIVLKDFSRNKLDVQSVRSRLSRLIATVKAAQSGDYSILLPILDNEWGVLNSEFNILLQHWAGMQREWEKELKNIQGDRQSVQEKMGVMVDKWSEKEKLWTRSWQQADQEWKNLLEYVHRFQEASISMHQELKTLKNVMYGVSDDLKVVKYHQWRVDRDIQSTSTMSDRFGTNMDRIKKLAALSTAISQKAGLIPSANGFKEIVNQWAEETVTTVVEVNEISANLRETLVNLTKEIDERPAFSDNSVNTYKTIEKNIESMEDLLKTISVFLLQIEKQRLTILSQGTNYKRQYLSDSGGTDPRGWTQFFEADIPIHKSI